MSKTCRTSVGSNTGTFPILMGASETDAAMMLRELSYPWYAGERIKSVLHIAELTRLVPTGLVYREIAKALHDKFGTSYSRNAVVGKIHRLGLVPPVKPRVGPRKRKPRDAAANEKRRLAYRRVGNNNIVRAIAVLEIEQLRSVEIECLVPFADVTGCRYTDSKSGPFLFCDGPQHPGSSYCASHHFLCWVPPRRLTDKVFARAA
jgi:GcrA cell cycle regulator